MSEDFYSDAARRQMELIRVERSAAAADLESARANSDYDTAATAVQQIANLDAAAANLGNLYQRHVQSQQPPAPIELSAEEKAAKPVNRMDYRDVYEMAKTSKHGVDDNAFRAGMAEVARRKRDEYGGR